MQDPAVELVDVSKAYSDFRLSNVSLRLEPGQIMGFIGRNGAGKSTTIRILMGLIRQDSGEVRVLGHPMPAEQIAAKWEIGFVSEDMRLYKNATLEWHMGFLRTIYPDWDQDYAELLLRRFDLRPGQKLQRFSHGERVKAMLLLNLARRPKLLILDEPTTGLDPVARREVRGEMMDVLLDEDRTVLFSSHNTQDVEQLADQITMIDRGRLIASDDKESFLENWRGLRLESAEGAALPVHEGLKVRRLGPKFVFVSTSHYGPHVRSLIETAGFMVQAVERMTLEEIFLASVEMGHVEGEAVQ